MPRVYKISYWELCSRTAGFSSYIPKHFYVRMPKKEFVHYLHFLRTNWPGYEFVYHLVET